MRALAKEKGLDLSESWAYSDSITDLPMLEAVGHAVAANPDRDLRRVAARRGWGVGRFRPPGGPSPPRGGAGAPPRRPGPPPRQIRKAARGGKRESFGGA